VSTPRRRCTHPQSLTTRNEEPAEKTMKYVTTTKTYFCMYINLVANSVGIEIYENIILFSITQT